jgi:hypothetical protein
VPYYKRAIGPKAEGGPQPADEAEQRIRQFYDMMAGLKLMKK